MSASKQCCTCKQTKPLTDYDRNRANLDGYQYRCRQCRRDFWQTNRERMADQRRREGTRRRVTLERFLADRIVVDNECWIWQGKARSGRDRSYGLMKWKGQTKSAHRYVYEVLVGPIPDGLVIDHLCRRGLCVNPAHLEPVTQGENIRRGLLGVLRGTA